MTTREAGASIRVSCVRKAYGAFTAIENLSLDVARGEFLTLLGASGCGKTTTLMLMAGFEQPTAGLIEINGRDMTRVPAQLRDQGFVFQNYALFPHLTVRRNLAYPLEVRGLPRSEIDARVERALPRFGLGGFGERLPRELSGGQQQRTALARALIYDPPLLLMDEPLAALDKNLRAQLQREIKALQRELRVTIIYVTHDQDEALALSDRIAVMNRGRIEQVGTPEDLYERPDGEFVASFMGEMNLIEVSLHESCGKARLRAAGGLDVAEAPPGHEGLANNVRMKACLRPEKLLLASRLQPGGGWREATVMHRTYLGDSERYELDVLGEMLVARRTTSPGCERFAMGARIAACWHDGDIRLVRASD